MQFVLRERSKQWKQKLKLEMHIVWSWKGYTMACRFKHSRVLTETNIIDIVVIHIA